MITDPPHKLDCCVISDGGAAFVMTTAERARDVRRPPVYVLGARGGADSLEHRADTRLHHDRRRAGRPRGVGAYGSFTITCLLLLEGLGFVERGEGEPFVAEGHLRMGGDLPMKSTAAGCRRLVPLGRPVPPGRGRLRPCDGPQEGHDHLRRDPPTRLASYKKSTRLVLVEEFPRSATGKIQRFPAEGADRVNKIVEGRVVIVTGAGRGIGRVEALAFAREGAKVVVKDLVTSDEDAAAAVVAEIEALGGEAIADHADVSDWAQGERLVASAVETYGDLHLVVNNADILRNRMPVDMSEDEWDDAIRVHPRGTFAVMRHAAAHWRARSKAGDDVQASVINTRSASGLYGNSGRPAMGPPRRASPSRRSSRRRNFSAVASASTPSRPRTHPEDRGAAGAHPGREEGHGPRARGSARGLAWQHELRGHRPGLQRRWRPDQRRRGLGGGLRARG